MNQMLGKSLIVIYFLLFVLALTLSTPLAQADRNDIDTTEDLKREIESILSEHRVPGATVALVTRDVLLWADGIGYSNVEAGTPVDAGTIFRWGSVSKSFVGASVQMLAERGLVHLDDKISNLVPDIEVHNPWESTHPLRLVHCLEHTTGFDDLHFTDCAVDAPDISVSDALAINPNSRRSRWMPGTYKSYSNIGPVVAARVVEAVSEREFEEFVGERIFEPLEMKTTGFRYPMEADLMATGYGDDGVTPVAYDHIAYRPAGSLNSSAKEIASFVRMLLNRGTLRTERLLTPQSITRMETPTTTLAAQAGFDLGYGLGIYSTRRGGHVFLGHDGMVAGFVASYGYNTELNCGYAVSINRASDKAMQQIIEAVVGYLTANVDSPLRPPLTRTENEILPLTGYYQSMTSMSKLMHTLLLRFVNARKVTVENGTLYSGNFLFGKRRELVPISNNGYHRSGSDESLAFIDDGDDTVICYDGLRGNFKKVTALRVYAKFGALILTLLIMASAIFSAIVWVPKLLIGRLKGVTYLKARLFPLLAVLCFFVTYISLLIGVMLIELDKAMMAKLGFLTVYSAAIFVTSLCFAAFSFLGLFFSVKANLAERGKASHVHSLLVSIVNVTATVYLWYGGVIGIMTWAY